MNNYIINFLSEFIGTFFFIMVIVGTTYYLINKETEILFGALSIGAIYTALYYTFSSFSGAHFNPAVSFGFFITERIDTISFILYIIAQILAAIAAVSFIFYIYPNNTTEEPILLNTNIWKAFLIEIIISYALVTVILFSTSNIHFSMFAGLAIGCVFAALVLLAGPLTGASMNPAKSLALSIFQNSWSTLWIFILAPVLGALFAGITWKIFNLKFDFLKSDFFNLNYIM